jgi:ABC-type amino acid transport system permease subunit
MKIIVLPQAFQVALPPLISQFSYLIKDTSLAAVVIVPEITYISRKVASQTYRPIESFGIPTLI